MSEQIANEIVIVQNKLKKIIYHNGIGNNPIRGQQIYATYCGKLENGVQFDSCTDKNNPFTFVIGQGQVIKGWDEGFATMKKGQKATLICSPQYAYGQNGSPPKIPSNATLHFDVQLIDFKDKQKQKWELSVQQKIAKATEKKNAGNSAFKKGQFSEAIRHYKSGIDFVDEDNNHTQNIQHVLKLNVAQSYLNDKQYSECIKYCSEVLKIQPQNPKALYRRGLSYSKKQDFQQAKADFQQLIKVDPQNFQAIKQLKNIETAKKKFLQKQKKVYAGMFSTQLYDDKKIQPLKQQSNDDKEGYKPLQEDQIQPEGIQKF